MSEVAREPNVVVAYDVHTAVVVLDVGRHLYVQVLVMAVAVDG